MGWVPTTIHQGKVEQEHFHTIYLDKYWKIVTCFANYETDAKSTILTSDLQLPHSGVTQVASSSSSQYLLYGL